MSPTPVAGSSVIARHNRKRMVDILTVLRGCFEPGCELRLAATARSLNLTVGARHIAQLLVQQLLS